jgi:hypothetical protein
MAVPAGALSRIDRVRERLAEVRTLGEVGEVLEDLEKMRRYAKVARWTLDQQHELARAWFEAQRVGGVMLLDMDKNRGAAIPGRGLDLQPRPPTLGDLGIGKIQAMNWQRYARVPEPEFVAILDALVEVRGLTTSGLLAHLPIERISRARPVAEAEADRAIVYQADYRDFLGQIDDESVDLLLTDPPYSTDVEDVAAFARDWLALAVPKVKRSGRAYVCIGAYPPELSAYLTVLLAQEHLTMAQVLVWTYRNTMGPSPRDDYKLNWQAVLYLRGPEADRLDSPKLLEQFSVMDVPAPQGGSTPRLHAWQKPDALAERIIRQAAPDDGVVLDPFAGTGTFLAAASRYGCRAIGSEVDGAMLALCERRGIEVIRVGD